MEVLGAVAATTELLGLTIKASKAAKSLVHSFRNAPTELIDLEAKLSLLRSSLEQMQSLSEDLASTSTPPRTSGSHPTTSILLPSQHREMLQIGLKTSLEALQRLKSLRDAGEGDNMELEKRPASLRDVRHRTRWAVLDKRKAARILQDVALAQSEIDPMLSILSVYVMATGGRSLLTIPLPAGPGESGAQVSTKAGRRCPSNVLLTVGDTVAWHR